MPSSHQLMPAGRLIWWLIGLASCPTLKVRSERAVAARQKDERLRFVFMGLTPDCTGIAFRGRTKKYQYQPDRTDSGNSAAKAAMLKTFHEAWQNAPNFYPGE